MLSFPSQHKLRHSTMHKGPEDECITAVVYDLLFACDNLGVEHMGYFFHDKITSHRENIRSNYYSFMLAEIYLVERSGCCHYWNDCPILGLENYWQNGAIKKARRDVSIGNCSGAQISYLALPVATYKADHLTFYTFPAWLTFLPWSTFCFVLLSCLNTFRWS